MWQVYMESAPAFDPNCQFYCGIDKPYMFYDGDIFCVTDATEKGGWQYVDFSVGTFVTDPEGITTTVKTNC